MYCVKPVTEDLIYLGGSDRRLHLFESAYPIPRGVSYNSYLLLDEKTVLFDTVDPSIGERFFENLEHALDGRALDYAVVHHMEPDHAGTLKELMRRYPAVKLIMNQKTVILAKRFFDCDFDACTVLVKDGESLNFGKHTLTFVFAPMVHWPEVMVSYDSTNGVLFSADAFGTFGALSGHIFADQYDFEADFMDDARRYYTNIVGKYGPPVQSVLKKAQALDIRMICPLHGPIWRKDFGTLIEKYDKWSRYEAEDQGVLIAYASIYGHTAAACDVLATALSELGVKKIHMVDVSEAHQSEVLADCFRYSHIVFASASYNAGLFVSMENLLHDLVAHGLKNRTIALIENGSWAPSAVRTMHAILEPLKGMTYLNEGLLIASEGRASEREKLIDLAKSIKASMEA